MNKQELRFAQLTEEYVFTDTLENHTDYFKVFEADGIKYYSPNDEDLGAIWAIDFEAKLAVYTEFYEVDDFEDFKMYGELHKSDYAFINHNGVLTPRYEID